MKWFRVDANFSRRINIDILADNLQVSDNEARGIVVSLWAATADLWEDGSLEGVSNRAIAKAIGWTLESGILTRGLIAAGYLQTSATTGFLSVVNWDTIGRPLMDTRNRQARKRKASRDSNVTVPLPSCDGHVTVTQHDTTRHDTSQDLSSLTSSCVASSSVFSARAREAVADAGQEGPVLDPPASGPETLKPDGLRAEQQEGLAAQAGEEEPGEPRSLERVDPPAWWAVAEGHWRGRFEGKPTDADMARFWAMLGDSRIQESDVAAAIRHHRLRSDLAPPIEDLADWIVRQARSRMAERLAGRNGHRRIEHELTPEEEAWKGRCRTALQGLYGPIFPSDIERRKFDALLAAGPHETEILEAIRIASERERCKPPHVPYIAKVAVELAAGRKERVAAREQAARQAETARAADILAGGRP